MKLFDILGNELLVRLGVVLNQYLMSSYRAKFSRKTLVWKDGSPLSLSTTAPDSRTQGPVGSVLYTTAYGDEVIEYFEVMFPNDVMQVRDFGLKPELPDCSPLWETISNYFPQGSAENFEFQAGGNYTFLTGMRVDSRAHHVFSPNPSKPFSVLVPGGVDGLQSYGYNGTVGIFLQNCRILATGRVPDGPRDENGVLYPKTDVRSDNPYMYNWYGAYIQNVVQFDNVEIGGFSGPGKFVIGYITANNPYSNNTSLSTFNRLKITGCGSDALVINGADANHMLYTNCDFRDNDGYGWTDDSLLGNHLIEAHFNNNRRGTFRSRGPGNSANYTNIYTEEFEERLTLPSANRNGKGYGGQLYGNARLTGGTVRPEGTNMPGSHVYCYDNAAATVGSYHTSAKIGQVSLGLFGMYFEGGLSFVPSVVEAGYRWIMGGTLVEYVSGEARLLQTNRLAQVDSANLANPMLNGRKRLLVNTYMAITAYNAQDGTPYNFWPGDQVDLRYVTPSQPPSLFCISGGRYFATPAEYTTGLSITTVQLGSGEYVQQVSGTGALPVVDSFILADGLGPLQVVAVEPDTRILHIAPNQIQLPGGTHAMSYAKPVFRPLGSGSGTSAQRPDLTGYAGPWQYFNTTAPALQTWTGTGWQ